MNTPQERVIKKMIDNIVESNKPSFERPATAATEAPRGMPSATHAAAPSAEDTGMITRKLDYGFNSLRQENVEMRKQIEELNGAIKMLRNDMDTVRQAVLRASSGGSNGGGHPQGSPKRDPPTEPMTSAAGGSLGAPQYRKTEADEAYDRSQGGSSQSSNDAPASASARGFQKKEDAGAQVDISKVFYYGKK
jgi:hypothetical protein